MSMDDTQVTLTVTQEAKLTPPDPTAPCCSFEDTFTVSSRGVGQIIITFVIITLCLFLGIMVSDYFMEEYFPFPSNNAAVLAMEGALLLMFSFMFFYGMCCASNCGWCGCDNTTKKRLAVCAIVFVIITLIMFVFELNGITFVMDFIENNTPLPTAPTCNSGDGNNRNIGTTFVCAMIGALTLLFMAAYLRAALWILWWFLVLCSNFVVTGETYNDQQRAMDRLLPHDNRAVDKHWENFHSHQRYQFQQNS